MNMHTQIFIDFKINFLSKLLWIKMDFTKLIFGFIYEIILYLSKYFSLNFLLNLCEEEEFTDNDSIIDEWSDSENEKNFQ